VTEIGFLLVTASKPKLDQFLAPFVAALVWQAWEEMNHYPQERKPRLWLRRLGTTGASVLGQELEILGPEMDLRVCRGREASDWLESLRQDMADPERQRDFLPLKLLAELWPDDTAQGEGPIPSWDTQTLKDTWEDREESSYHGPFLPLEHESLELSPLEIPGNSQEIALGRLGLFFRTISRGLGQAASPAQGKEGHHE